MASQQQQPVPVDKTDYQPGLLISLVPKIPLILRTTILHLLHLTKQSQYLDLRTELITTTLKSFMTPDVPISITATQRHLVKEIEVKGPLWVAKYACPAPQDDGIQQAVAAAIEGLRESSPSGEEFKLKMPEAAAVEAEWTGHRSGADPKSRLPDIPEKAKYAELMKEVTHPTTVLYFHGGAFWLMDPATHRTTTRRLAKLTGGRTYSVRYRLAPKHPFPSALMDALESYLCLLYPPPGAFHEPVAAEHVVFAGDSAGGNLALSLLQTLLYLKRTNTPVLWQGVSRQVPLPAGVGVNSPWVDITHSMPSCDANSDYDYLPSLRQQLAFEPVRRKCAQWPTDPPRAMVYAADELVMHPLVSVILARDWTGAPPLWICTGRELLADEDKFTAKKFWADGVPVVYDEFEGMPHCFALLFGGNPEGRRCLDGWAGFARRVVDGEEVKSKFSLIKARSCEEVEVDPKGLSPYSREESGDKSQKKMERHAASVAKIAGAVRAYFEKGEAYRIFHGSTNSTRPRSSLGPPPKSVDISALSQVLQVDSQKKIALVEPNVPMDALVEATLPHGLVPPVVMEFPGITAGGGFAGTAGESSSFRHGFFDDTVEKVEMVLADGEVVSASRTERGDLFRGAAGAVGTLGVTTLLEVKLMEAKKFVRTRYRRTNSVSEAVEAIRDEMGKAENDYVDGILFGEDHGVVVTGTLTDTKPEGGKVQTFSGAWDPWFYLHARDKTASAGMEEDYVPLAEYLFRYDRGGFWVGAAAFRYFWMVPFTRATRWFLDDFLHTRMMYRALHGSGESARFVVQDIAMPFSTAEDLVKYTSKELNIWPLWLCPLQRRAPPTFHPHTTTPADRKRDGKEEDMMLNIGVWGWGPNDPRKFVEKNRALEKKVAELGGMKWLYAHTYYPADEFWGMYGGRGWYDALRQKYKASTLPTVHDKVFVDPEGSASKKRGWMRKLPLIPGLYGIAKSIQSRDYMLHRDAKWKWKGDEQ
ncbi:alpha/beta hydrolase fold-domain-containing protein [Echria macrotheca]|uniref:Delta(24)-sterol reductase n=1 Tax=Echria macrotheca TaxID=438768 RepID=A0AAJ0F5G3_9PEZI|nr:alpha/beta hydrolase fold-domain-containing protein [Echria macrotheca]